MEQSRFKIEMYCKVHNEPLFYFGQTNDGSTTDMVYVLKDGVFGIDFSEIDCRGEQHKPLETWCKNQAEAWTVKIVEKK